VEEEGKFRSVFDMKLANSNAFPWQDGKLSNNSPIIDSLGLPKVHAVTVNEISTNPERISYYAKTTGASVESMEGAAFHYVALMEKIPFVQLRSLSNFAGERNKENWRMEDAITSLNETLKSLIVNLNGA
jgi:futalosine hydrolase